jgi:lipoprotein-releasing system permease protein
VRVELFLAVRLLRDSRRQSILIGLGVAVGVAVIVFLSALIGGLQRDLIQKTVGSQANVVIRPAQEAPRPLRARDGLTLSRIEQVSQRVRSIDGWRTVVERLGHTRGVTAAAPVCRGPARVARGNASYNVTVTGVDPKRYQAVVDLRSKVSAGELDTQGRGALIGSRLAKLLGTSVGDKLRLQAGESEDAAAEVFEVRGVLSLGNRVADETTVLVSLRSAQALLDLTGGATAIEVAVDSLYDASAIARRIRQETGLDAVSWMESNAELLAGLRAQSSSSLLIQVFVLLAVAIGIASVLVVSVVQRTREIGILRAIGLTQGQAKWVFLIQGGLLAGLGAVVGSGFGAGLVQAFAVLVKDRSGEALFPIDLSLALLAFASAVAIATGIVAAYLPARSAARLDPVVAIRNE